MRPILFFLIFTLLISCKSDSDTYNGYIIEGHAPGVYNGIRSYIKTAGQRGRQIPIDTAIVFDETFIFKGAIDDPGQYFLYIDNIQKPLPILLTKEKMTITINKDDMSASEIKGSKVNDDYKKFNEDLKFMSSELQILANERRIATFEKDSVKTKSIDDKLINKQKEIGDYASNFIKNNPKSLVSLILLEQQITAREIDFENVKSAYENLDKDLKNTSKAKAFYARLQALLEKHKKEAAISIGKIAPNFEAPTPDGNLVSLNDIKGKVTIIDFWAAWCGPCRRENPNVVKVYEKFHNKGLEIIGVSLDGNTRQQDPKKAWLDAIEKDGLTWNHVSHLKYFQDPVAQLYNIQSIPATYILNEKGEIVAKNLRGKALENKIEELLNAI